MLIWRKLHAKLERRRRGYYSLLASVCDHELTWRIEAFSEEFHESSSVLEKLLAFNAHVRKKDDLQKRAGIVQVVQGLLVKKVIFVGSSETWKSFGN